MSAEYYGYPDYESMLRHTEHNGGGIDADANVVEFVVEKLDELAQLRAERDALAKELNDARDEAGAIDGVALAELLHELFTARDFCVAERDALRELVMK